MIPRDNLVRRSSRWPLRIATAMLAGLIVHACSTVSDPSLIPVRIMSLSITPPLDTIVINDSTQLHAVGINLNGVPFVQPGATWESSDPAVATVSATGRVHAVAVGAATVTATQLGFTATADVFVTPRPVFVASDDSVAFSGVANGPTPGAQAIDITNGGGGTLTGMAVDSIVYTGMSGWLNASLATGEAPDVLTLQPNTTALPIDTYVATVFMSAPQTENSPFLIKVTFAVGAGAPASMVLDAGDAQTDTIGAKLPALRVKIADTFGNGVPGVVVSWATSGGAAVTLPTSTTDALGIASDTLVLGTAVGVQGATATASGVPGSPISFAATATHGNAAVLSISGGNAQTDTIGATLTVALAARVADRGNNPVDGITVNWAAAVGSVTASSVTATNGIATATRTLGTAVGLHPATATVAGLSGSPLTFTATVTNGNATDIQMNGGNAQTDTIGAPLPVAYSVRLRDRAANAVVGATVNWVASGGSITASSVTNAVGIAAATRTLGTVAGAQGATATAVAMPGSPIAFTATATHGNATTIAKNGGDAQSATVSSPVAIEPSAIVLDRAGNPVQGTAVTFATTPSNGVVAPTTPIITGANGVAQTSSWTMGAVAKPDTLTAAAAGLTGSPLIFTATAISGSATQMALNGGNAQTDTISATLVQYSVLITDNLGNPVSGVPVGWAVTGGGSITPSSSTNASGIAVATRVLGTTPGAQNATASVGGLIGSPVQFTATALVGNAANIAVFGGNGQIATVATNVTTPPSARVTDRVGNPVSGRSVTFAVTGGAGSVNPGTALTTNASGVVQVTSWTLGTTAGANALSATSAGLTGSPVAFSATGIPGPVSAAQSLVSAGTSSIDACSSSCVAGSTASVISVTARDQFGNTIPSASVTISSSGANNAFSPTASGTTNGSGVFSSTFNSTLAQAKTMSATANAVGITQTAVVTVTAAAVSTTISTLVAATSSIDACSGTCSNGSTASLVTVTIRDAFSNPISGATVTPSCSVGTSCAFVAASGTTNASGVFTTSFRSTLAQAKTIRATVTGTGLINASDGVTVVAAAPASVAVTNEGFSARVGTGVGTRPTFTVRDAFLNPVPSYPVSYTSSTSGVFAGPSATNASGQATLTSWTMSGSAVDDALGRMANNVTLFANGFSNTATSYGIYTYSFDVGPLIGTSSGCQGCHYTSWTRANIVGQAAQDPIGYNLCVGGTLVVAFNAAASQIYQKLSTASASICGDQMPPPSGGFTATELKIVRAWINNGAPNN